MQAKKDAVLQRKIADANAARKKLRELQAMSKGSSAAAGSGSSASSDSNGPNPLARTISSGMASGAGRVNHGSINALEVQPNPDAPLLRTEKQRREWIDLQLDHCNLSSEYRKVLEGELAQVGGGCGYH
jgi:kinesin family protein 4/21/27